MKKIKILLIAVGLLFTSALLNETKASNTVVVNKKDNQKILKVELNKKPDIYIIYLYESCADGTMVYTGNIGFANNGALLGAYYWGIGSQCDGHGALTEV